MEYAVTIDEKTKHLSIRSHPDGGWLISVDGSSEEYWRGDQIAAAEWVFHCGDRKLHAGVGLDGAKARMQLGPYPVLAKVTDRRSLEALSGVNEADQGKIVSSIPGAVVRVQVAVGQSVSEGEVLLVVEAMKMENEFKAPFDGIVEQIYVNPGETVEGGQTLITVAKADD